MKLILCKECSDVFKLDAQPRTCKCGRSRGRYVDDLYAVYTGKSAIPLGILNGSLVRSVRSASHEFKGFVFSPDAPTFERVKPADPRLGSTQSVKHADLDWHLEPDEVEP